MNKYEHFSLTLPPIKMASLTDEVIAIITRHSDTGMAQGIHHAVRPDGRVDAKGIMPRAEHLRKAMLSILDHEVREFIRYKGKAVYAPHAHLDGIQWSDTLRGEGLVRFEGLDSKALQRVNVSTNVLRDIL